MAPEDSWWTVILLLQPPCCHLQAQHCIQVPLLAEPYLNQLHPRHVANSPHSMPLYLLFIYPQSTPNHMKSFFCLQKPNFVSSLGNGSTLPFPEKTWPLFARYFHCLWISKTWEITDKVPLNWMTPWHLGHTLVIPSCTFEYWKIPIFYDEIGKGSKAFVSLEPGTGLINEKFSFHFWPVI